ncbi:MAG: hypothetical protein MnENMB40S_02370 [Rhizobiaceae bacterium MnEN-MB40S]|nr:MAG: hypothetical protein MnENMB40S_02370 [Rhizobiaceae bacterium MnEN-MB40S]
MPAVSNLVRAENLAIRLVTELIVFACKQAYASLFGGLLLAFMLFTRFVELPLLDRYDYIFLFAILTQIVLIVARLETRREVMVIFGFHVVATVMEIFKTSEAIGSWNYPEHAYFAIFGVPLFAGFMYSAVGSYIARAWKILKLRFTDYPPLVHTYVLAGLVYLNFFTHHFVFDIRYFLVAYAVILFRNTRVWFTVLSERHMPLLLGFLLISFFIWIAENVATFANVWLYPSQELLWTPVSLNKLVAWFLLMIISFVLVSLLYRRTIRTEDRAA